MSVYLGRLNLGGMPTTRGGHGLATFEPPIMPTQSRRHAILFQTLLQFLAVAPEHKFFRSHKLRTFKVSLLMMAHRVGGDRL